VRVHRYSCGSLKRSLGMVAVMMAMVAVATGTTSTSNATDDVLLGYFGPAAPNHPQGGDLWCAACLALEKANAAGGCHGRPFRLVASWSANPWGTGVADVARLAYIDQVWAIIAGFDGASVHLAEQIVAKARLVLMNAAATDKSINMASVPWMFSSAPLDDAQAAVLAEAIAAEVQTRSFAVVSAIDHDSHAFTVELLKALKERALAPAFHFDCEPAQPTTRSVLERVQRSNAAAVVLIAGAADTAQLLRTLRDVGCEAAVFGGPWMSRRAFVEQAGVLAEGVKFPYLLAPSPKFAEFAQRFTQRFGRGPDYAAAHMYDTVSLLVAAIRQAGLDRTGIQGAVRELSPWSGVTGEIRWDTVGANCRPVRMGTINAAGQIIEDR